MSAASAATWAAAQPASAAFPPPDPHTTLLVVAPHPDDEILCCAGAIQQVLAAGGRVSIVWLTSGDGSYLGALVIEKSPLRDARHMRAYGMRRMAEARAAADTLGVARSGQLFLGYPDGGLLSLLRDPAAPPLRSKFTDATSVPYPEALYPGHPYTGASLRADFDAVLAQVHPTLVLAPTPLDSHPDHRAAGLLARAAAAHRELTLRYWIVHGGEGWPSPRGLSPGIPLTVAPRARGLDPQPLQLSPAEEDRKLAALNAYATQLKVLTPFLTSFIRTTELFSVRAEP
ncbi:MAG: PIG-L family deacetylase [Proteobacteria bacterium]|nr:PIG-L family deacetylase [Pseudomonadota bacterium]